MIAAKSRAVTYTPVQISGATSVLGGFNDHDAGGWVTAETIRNLAMAIAEKTRKIQPFHAKYAQWWLVLIDHIGHGSFERHELEPYDRTLRASRNGRGFISWTHPVLSCN